MLVLLSPICSINAMERYPLHEAIKNAILDGLKALLLSNNGADANKQDNCGLSTAEFGCLQGSSRNC